MKELDKELLLKDLSARLPYDIVVLEDIDKEFDGGCISKLATIIEIKGEKRFLTKNSLTPVTIEEIRPYLRPLSSMTEEEKKIMRSCGFELIHYDTGHIGFANIENCIDEVSFKFMEEFLNAHYFNYRGLIEKGLALEAPEGMYKID